MPADSAKLPEWGEWNDSDIARAMTTPAGSIAEGLARVVRAEASVPVGFMTRTDASGKRNTIIYESAPDPPETSPGLLHEQAVSHLRLLAEKADGVTVEVAAVRLGHKMACEAMAAPGDDVVAASEPLAPECDSCGSRDTRELPGAGAGRAEWVRWCKWCGAIFGTIGGEQFCHAPVLSPKSLMGAAFREADRKAVAAAFDAALAGLTGPAAPRFRTVTVRVRGYDVTIDGATHEVRVRSPVAGGRDYVAVGKRPAEAMTDRELHGLAALATLEYESAVARAARSG